jgi:transposase
MLEDHWLGVIRGHHSRLSNGLLEGLNSLIQAAKRRARGYRFTPQLHRDDLPHRPQTEARPSPA